MDRCEFKKEHDTRECDVCHSTVKYYIDNFRIDLCLPEKCVILGTDLFTSYICLKCLMEEIKQEFVKDLKKDKKNKYQNGNL